MIRSLMLMGAFWPEALIMGGFCALCGFVENIPMFCHEMIRAMGSAGYGLVALPAVALREAIRQRRGICDMGMDYEKILAQWHDYSLLTETVNWGIALSMVLLCIVGVTVHLILQNGPYSFWPVTLAISACGASLWIPFSYMRAYSACKGEVAKAQDFGKK